MAHTLELGFLLLQQSVRLLCNSISSVCSLLLSDFRILEMVTINDACKGTL